MIIEEGSAKIEIPEEKKLTRKLPAFYNPVMKLNRDITVLLLNSIENTDMQIADILAGTGIRSVRFLKELSPGKIKALYANDHSESAVGYIKKNLKLNGLADSGHVLVSNEDANMFLLKGSGFDYIDIDPFGSPVDFLPASVTRLSREGILAVTATDTAALSGSMPNACQRRYHAKPLRNEFMHETAIRILIKKVQESAAEHEKALTPIFSYAYEHYYRVFFRCEKGRQKADSIMKKHGFIIYCPKCLDRRVVYTALNNERCAHCNSALDYAGLLWTGRLWDGALAEKMVKNAADKYINSFISAIRDEAEADSAGFYDVSVIARNHNIKRLPKINDLIERIRKQGFSAARTHFSGQGIRTDCDLYSLLRYIRLSKD